MSKLHRYWIAFISSLITNSYLISFFHKKIYTGKLKFFCSPGLNCYSCPASIFACPIGIIQHIFASIRNNISTGKYILGLYTFGILGIIGTLGGRFVCGWICPFGFLQEIIYKIPFKKYTLDFKFLRYLKYFILIFMVILLPMIIVDKFGFGETVFCKYFCPAGTLEAGLTLPYLIPPLKKLIGTLYYWKASILFLFLFLFVVTKRPFCRYFCPLGAIYSLFNKISFLQIKRNENLCVKCMKCVKSCPMHLNLDEICNDLNCIKCYSCKKACKFGAIN